MEKVCSKARSGEVVPEKCVALKWARGRLEVDRFAQERGESVTLANEGGVVLTRSAYR